MAILHLLHLWPGRTLGSPSRGCPTDSGAARRPLSSLTHRQREVLGLLAAGKSTREMAEHLYLSPGTVRTHVENILRALDVHSRLEAVIVAARENLV
jgi:DNA-binding NarL/FixJ family response regulator